MWRAQYQMAGTDPEPLETAQRAVGGFQILRADRGLRQHRGMPLMHRGQSVAQPSAFFGQPNIDRAPVVQRALLCQIPVLLLDVVRYVGAELV